MTENIEVFIQNSIRIKCSAGTVYIDPFRMEDEPKDADIIFVTHDHYDHFSPEDIEKAAGNDTVLIVPEKMEKKTGEVSGIIKETVTVAPGGSYDVRGMHFETIPAYNEIKMFHPKRAGWVGYVLEADGKRIYIAGDTDATKEAGEVKCDIALIPIGGFYTMNAKEAADLINTIRPETAIPTHYGSLVGSLKDGDKFRELVNEQINVELKIRA